MESFQFQPETKLPPGKRHAGMPVSFRPLIKSVRNPRSSAVGCLGLYIVPFTMVPIGSKNVLKSLSEISPIVNEGWIVIFASFPIITS